MKEDHGVAGEAQMEPRPRPFKFLGHDPHLGVPVPGGNPAKGALHWLLCGLQGGK